jgi:hypothetical protein
MRQVAPGDVLVVRTPAGGFWARVASVLIRLGAGLELKPNQVDHVAIVHHVDADGVTWVVEGRPGGVGWAVASEYDNPYLVTNADESKTDAQRQRICELARGLLGVAYDWTAIAVDGLEALHLTHLWGDDSWGPKPPAHVVCSTLADYAYTEVGLKHPGNGRRTTPADWAALFITYGWR